MNSESETVEEEEKVMAFWRMKYLRYPKIDMTDAPLFDEITKFAANFASSLLQEKERERNALVTLLRAKCSDSEWAEMGDKFGSK